MKKLLLLFILLVYTESFSKCINQLLYSYPYNGEIINDQSFIISAKGELNYIVLPNSRVKFYLESENEKVKLTQTPVLENRFQLELNPTRKLTIGENYKLKIENTKDNISFELGNWVVTSEIQTDFITSRITSSFLPPQIETCGMNSHYSSLKLTENRSNRIFRVVITNKKNSSSEIIYTSTNEYGEILIGRGNTCQTEYDFEINDTELEIIITNKFRQLINRPINISYNKKQ